MSDDELRYGIVGCAGMGTTHADAVAKTEGTHLVACSDISEEIANDFAAEYDCAAYTDVAEMVRDADVDVVSVCTPNGTHAEIVEEIAAEGAHVLCEKPLDVTPGRVNRVIDACEEAGVKLGCIYQRRTMGGPQLANEAIENGDLGDMILGDVQVKWHREDDYFEEAGWRGTTDLDGGVLYTQALHGIDLLQWVMGGVKRVCAAMDTLHQTVEVPDTAVMAVEFENGAFGHVSGSTSVYPQYPITLQVHGTEGSIRWHQDELDEYTTIRDEEPPEPEPFHLGKDHLGQVRDFVRAVREDDEPMVPPAEARKALDLVFAAEESAERNEWVDVREF